MNGILRTIGKACFLCGILFLFRWWYSLGVFNIKYYTYESMFQWMAVFLILTIIAGIIVFFSKKSTRNEKLLAVQALILIAVTPLGSNNHLYPNMNNMFLVFPFALSVFWNVLQKLGRISYLELKEWKASLYPVWSMFTIFLAVTAVQCFLFGVVFTFRDGMSGQKRNTKIEKNTVLKGMVTNKELAESIEELTGYIEEKGLSEEKALLYGGIPAASYILDMPSAISTTWPDLRSYGYEVMAADMEQMKEAALPVIILSAGLDGYLRGDETAMEKAELPEPVRKAYETDEKLKLITDFMEEKSYERTFGNARFAVYTKKEFGA